MPPLQRDDLIAGLMKELNQRDDPELYNDTLQSFQNASDDQLRGWFNQQNDPGQMRENALRVGGEAASRSLTQDSFPEISAEARSELAKELSNDMNSLESSLTQQQPITRKQEQELER